MTARPSIAAFYGNRAARWIFYAIAIVAAGLLCLFPRPYVARMKILPQDSQAGAGALIGALGGGVQNFAAVLGQQKTNYLIIGRSHDVQRDVVDRLGLLKTWGKNDHAWAERKLASKVEIQLLTGGVLEVTARDRDPAFAQALVQGFTTVIKGRLADLGLEQVEHKRELITTRLKDSTGKLAAAESALSAYRSQYNLPSPEIALGVAISRRVGLESQVRGKELELDVARRFVTDESLRVRTLTTELAALRRQLAEVNQPTVDDNASILSNQVSEYLRLYRDQQFAENIVNVYRRFFEEVSVEELSASTNVQIIEQPYVDPHRQFNLTGIGLSLAVLLAALYTEYYMPMTRLGGSSGRRPREGES